MGSADDRRIALVYLARLARCLALLDGGVGAEDPARARLVARAVVGAYRGCVGLGLRAEADRLMDGVSARDRR